MKCEGFRSVTGFEEALRVVGAWSYAQPVHAFGGEGFGACGWSGASGSGLVGCCARFVRLRFMYMWLVVACAPVGLWERVQDDLGLVQELAGVFCELPHRRNEPTYGKCVNGNVAYSSVLDRTK